ncbi:deoxyribodipyrimidine photo-lyase [Streptococcus iniae]|nr:deoxyribodipyrimidine photo-lyase [Streptococcus iniae]
MVAVIWFRRDLRIQDNKALKHAIDSGGPLLAVFHLNPKQLRDVATVSQSAFIQSLQHFRRTLDEKGIFLHVIFGELQYCFEHLQQALPDWTDVYFNYDDAGFGRKRDQEATHFFREKGIAIHAYQDHYLHGSQEVINQASLPYKVFTPYYKKWSQLPKETPIVIDYSQVDWLFVPNAKTVDSKLNTLFRPLPYHKPGEEAALERLHLFIEEGLEAYDVSRDYPEYDGTSRLSVYLRTGEINIRTVYAAISKAKASKGKAVFIKELVWREFYHMIYVNHPHQKQESLQAQFVAIEWENDQALFEQWKAGTTGYPMVDATMRQLSQTGWMHNRLRMIVASFLVKDLLIDWRWGEEYFQEALMDYDSASNIGGWQWAASTGTDAVPYFRIFNPTTQAKRFDPKGHFIKTYVPQLEALPLKWLYEPWKLPLDLQDDLGFKPERDYPLPIVSHDIQRKKAIAKYEWAKEVYQTKQ